MLKHPGIRNLSYLGLKNISDAQKGLFSFFQDLQFGNNNEKSTLVAELALFQPFFERWHGFRTISPNSFIFFKIMKALTSLKTQSRESRILTRKIEKPFIFKVCDNVSFSESEKRKGASPEIESVGFHLTPSEIRLPDSRGSRVAVGTEGRSSSSMKS